MRRGKKGRGGHRSLPVQCLRADWLLVLAHGEKFLVEMPHGKTVPVKVAAQGLCKICRTAEPDAGIWPFWYSHANVFTAQVAIVPGVHHVQPDAGGISVGLQQGHGGRVIVGGAVKQIHIGRLLASLGNFLQAGNEGRDADAASHPDLAGRRVVEGEAAVWAACRA